MSLILAINAGSSSIKYAVFDGAQEVLRGAVEEVRDHGAALTRVLAELEEGGVAPSGLAAVAHRVVHGGMERAEALRVDEAVLAVIRDAVPLAPLHNPANLAAIEAFMALAPDVPQVACFDTAFHATIPDVAARYALPPEAEALGLRRYGFHGISYSSLTARMPEIAGALPRRLLACHLGNGASLAAILDGRSVATTMGYSPLDGLTMGTRSGSIDGNAVLKIAEEFGIDGAGVMLNKHSGLLGLSGISSDMRVLRASDDARAAFAIDHFLNALVTHAGAMIAAMGGIDAIAFTGGIGENDVVLRRAMLERLSWLGIEPRENGPRLTAEHSSVSAWIVPAKEEARMMELARGVIGL